MILIIQFLFWFSLGILFYCYLGYGLLLYPVALLKRFFHRSAKQEAEELLPVTLIVTAYNEGAVLPEKIANTLAIDYPAGKLHLLFVTDGSSDDSEKLLLQYPQITLLHQPLRQGKYAAIKRAMTKVQTPVVVFSDANTMLNPECLRRMMKHYRHPAVGGVAGEKKIRRDNSQSAVGGAEGLYWRYESFMKKLDAGLYTVVGAAGELYSVRTHLFAMLPDDLVLDDFVTSMRVCQQGFRIAYEPGAFAIEQPSLSLADEEKRKVRISAGAYQSVHYLHESLNIFRHPALAFQYISRRLLRWFFCPLLLFVFLFTNILLAAVLQHPLFVVSLGAQLLFYTLAIRGWLLARSGRRPGLFTIPFYFVFMNYCLVKGFFVFIKGRQTVLWEKSLRVAESGE